MCTQCMWWLHPVFAPPGHTRVSMAVHGTNMTFRIQAEEPRACFGGNP